MNVLLYAPPLLLLMLKVRTLFTVEDVAFITSRQLLQNCSCRLFFKYSQAMDISGVILALAGAALVQVPYLAVSVIYICNVIFVKMLSVIRLFSFSIPHAVVTFLIQNALQIEQLF